MKRLGWILWYCVQLLWKYVVWPYYVGLSEKKEYGGPQMGAVLYLAGLQGIFISIFVWLTDTDFYDLGLSILTGVSVAVVAASILYMMGASDVMREAKEYADLKMKED